MAGEVERYRVKLPFRSATGHKLTAPLELASLEVTSDGEDYIATILVDATRGQHALELARGVLADMFAAFAVRQAGFVEILDARRLVQLVDPQPVLEGPIPPLDVVGGGIFEGGLAWLDPTGEHRRARRILNINANLTLTMNIVDRERKWLAIRDRWPDDLRRALALIHAGEVSGNPDVAFVLAFSALEVVAEASSLLLGDRIADPPSRSRFLAQVRAVLEAERRLGAGDVERLMNGIAAVQAVSPIPRFEEAFAKYGIQISKSELEWVRQQRGAFIHPGGFDISTGASERRQAFRKAVSTLIGNRFDQLSETVKAGL